MVIFIDESGTHTQTGHATTAIVYISILNLDKVEQELLNIEKEIKIQTFHWGEERWQVWRKLTKNPTGKMGSVSQLALQLSLPRDLSLVTC